MADLSVICDTFLVSTLFYIRFEWPEMRQCHHEREVSSFSGDVISFRVTYIAVTTYLWKCIDKHPGTSSASMWGVGVLLFVAHNFGRAESKHCFGACAAVRLLSWRWELLPEPKTLPATQRTIHLTTLQNATFQTGSTHAAKTAPPAPRVMVWPLYHGHSCQQLTVSLGTVL
jgi:hypothetical protein